MDSSGGAGPAEQRQENEPPSRLGRAPKEGERILAPTRRPDGTLRKPIRIRAGYVPQDEVAIYQSKGTLLRKSAQPEVPPGYDPVLDAKPKTKSGKRNERKKEKKLQASLASSEGKGKTLESNEAEEAKDQGVSSSDHVVKGVESVESLTSQMNSIAVSSTQTTDPSESLNPELAGNDLDKKIRALKKKIRLAEAQQKGDQQNMKPEQREKLEKVQGWREELNHLEDKKAAQTT